MTSAAQVRANRSNARKSTGPRTPEGKAAAARNAVKHGLLAEQVVIKGEDPAEFESYREGMLGELAPAGKVEEMLAERVVSLSWRLQSAVFATVYRENANDVVLWPKHGLPIQPGPGEDEVILGQVVMTDFAHAQVLDRLLVHERRIESSLYRTMAQLRRERQARTAVAVPGNGSPAELGSFGANVAPKNAAGVAASEGVSHPEGCPAGGLEPVAPEELGSFGADAAQEAAGAKREASNATYPVSSGVSDLTRQGSHFKLGKTTPYGVATNTPTDGNHGRDARATKTLHTSRSILRNEANRGECQV